MLMLFFHHRAVSRPGLASRLIASSLPFFLVPLGHLIINGVNGHLSAQEPVASIDEITTAERLALEQIDQLLATEQYEEVVRLVTQTIDESEGRLVRLVETSDDISAEQVRPNEFDFARFIPLSIYLQDRLLRWGKTSPGILALYRERVDSAANSRLKRLKEQRQWPEAVRAADQLLASSVGDEALLLVADLALERGWYWTAIAALRRIDPRWQVCDPGPIAKPVAALGWEYVLPELSESQFAGLLAAWPESWVNQQQPSQGWPIGCFVDSKLPPAEVGLRLVLAFNLAGERVTAERLGAMLSAAMPDVNVMLDGSQVIVADAVSRILEFQHSVVDGGDWLTLGHAADRVYQTSSIGDLPLVPSWTVNIKNRELNDFLPKELPIGWSVSARTTEGDQPVAARVLPIIHRGLVVAQEDRGIRAYELLTGESWPVAEDGTPLYEDTSSDGLQRKSAGLPIDGQPWQSLSASDGYVLGRFGPSESGWLSVIKPELSLSKLMLIDVDRDGRAVDGYPIQARKLSPESRAADDRPGFEGAEFEGTGLVIGGKIYVGLSTRNDANLSSSVACYDLASGTLLFQTKVISAARPIVDTLSNRMSQSVVSYREGTVYYHGDSGAVAAIDAEDGSIRWLMRYPRAELNDSAYPSPRRSKAIQASPAAIVGPLAIASPSDCDRLFAVDANTGRLIWATAIGEADDIDQILGQIDGQVIAGGDSLYRLDRGRGLITGRWPAATTRQKNGALPNPRRQGRGLIAGDKIYWPTRDSIWVFDARSLAPMRQLSLFGTGLVGGDLAAADNVLVISDGKQIAAFVTESSDSTNKDKTGNK